MELSTILKAILETGGPAMAVAVMGLWYLHRQTEKKDDSIDAIREENKDLVKQLIDDKEKRLIADQQNRELIKSLIEKNGATSAAMREYFARMEENQKAMLEKIHQLQSKI